MPRFARKVLDLDVEHIGGGDPGLDNLPTHGAQKGLSDRYGKFRRTPQAVSGPLPSGCCTVDAYGSWQGCQHLGRQALAGGPDLNGDNPTGGRVVVD